MVRKLHIVYSIFIVLFGLWGYQALNPPGEMGAYLNGVFPSKVPGLQGSFHLDDVFPELDITAPVRIIPFSDTDDILILSKGGQLLQLDIINQEKTVVLDISSRTFKLGDCGSVGVALHPKFDPDTDSGFNKVFIYYKTKPNPEEWDNRGFNRLSSFEWDIEKEKFDENSELILIQQYDRSSWHDGGSMFFGIDEFLYLAIGDEGFDEFQSVSSQRIDGGFFSGILRIDVDNDPLKSHPIRRQPQSNEEPPDNWGESFSQHYSIPNDNPWLSEEGEILEEFYAIGIRSPFTMQYDESRKLIWLADVGSEVREEINLIDKSDNCQWPYREGYVDSEVHERPINYIGNEKEVYYEVERGVSSCIIGGGSYQGIKFPNLNGKYLFADYNLNKLFALTSEASGEESELEVLISDIRSLPIDLPEKPGITGVYEMLNGDIFISVMGEDYSKEGKIFKLRKTSEIKDPPAKLSELGVFTDLNDLAVIDGVIPYDINAPLYSDGAFKKRWIAIPNDGVFDSASERIKFSREEDWRFPEGTVFIKHFELKVSDQDSGIIVPLETRFLIMAEANTSYGLTYKWNEEGTDAILLGGGTSKSFDIYENGQYSYTQDWGYPSRDQCMTCHTQNAEFVLGVKTHQLNKEIVYPQSGLKINQLEYFNQNGLFDENISLPSDYIKSSSITDDEVDLEWRIRSYLDSNCSSCHRFGGLSDVFLDFRLLSSRKLNAYYDLPNSSRASTQGGLIIKPGYHSNSELWIRDSSLGENKMPPIGRSLADQIYVDSLAKWIDNIEPDDNIFIEHEMIVYPNPTTSWVAVSLDDEWLMPADLNLYSSSGHLLMQSKLENQINYLNLELYPSGTYFISVVSGDRRENRKVIKK